MPTQNESAMEKRVRFIYVENACRSQMAEGFAKHYGKGGIEAYSACSRPGDRVNPSAVRAMREKGIGISRQKPKGFDQVPQIEFDYVITMGCQDACPIIPAKARIEWDIPDPRGKSIDAFRDARDEIGRKVEELVEVIFRNPQS